MHPQKVKLIEIKNLKKYFAIQKSVFDKQPARIVKAVDDVSFCIYQGETLGLVGESGSGKTTTGRTILRALDPTAGEICFYPPGEPPMDIAISSYRDLKNYRRYAQMIFQDPYSSLSPRMTVRDIIAEPLVVNRHGKKEEQLDRIQEITLRCGLKIEHLRRYPHAFSGGQRQRIGIARALALHPQFVVCDEPVSALDVSIQAQILNLLKTLQAELNLTYLFIAHDLSVVEYICDRVAVMYLGKLVELGDTQDLFQNPRHPYTEALMSAIPVADPHVPMQPMVLPGEIPDPSNPPPGCTFHPRCKYAQKECSVQVPTWTEVAPGHLTACHLAGSLTLKGTANETQPDS